MPATLAQWDERHREAAASGKPADPANIVLELLPLLPRGHALDIACGAGRHSLLLAQRGWKVTAVDGSLVALENLRVAARRESIDAVEQHSLNDRRAASHAAIHRAAIHVVQVDLERAHLPANGYDLIVCIHYLKRSSFPQFVAALRPGGMLLMETYTKAQLQFAAGPRNPAYLLERGELRHAFPGLHTIFSRELCAEQGIASLLAQKRIAD